MSTIAPGAHIELRDAVWRVIRVDQSSTGQQAWTCVGVSEIVRDMPALFLEEMEDKRPRVLDPRTTELVRDSSSQHRAGLLTIEAHLRDVPAPRDGLHVGHMAAMDALDYQLDPAWMALQAPRARILIADSVGLGKTLEAGILLSELIQRGQGRRILVAVTKAMLAQFQKEMWCRFSIPLVRMDSVGLQRIRSRLPSHHNPFYAFDRVIVSIDTLKQDNAFRAHLEAARWDVVAIDEAHNVAMRGKGAQRAQLARMLARRTDHLLLLSATPHAAQARRCRSRWQARPPQAFCRSPTRGSGLNGSLQIRHRRRRFIGASGHSLPAADPGVGGLLQVSGPRTTSGERCSPARQGDGGPIRCGMSAARSASP